MRWVLVLVLFVLATAGTASAAAPPPAKASDSPTAGETRPWAVGVSEANQEKATKLFDEATDLLKDAFFKRAVELYIEALKYWDHPAIHFNLAKALMNMDNPAAAYEHLKASMRFGGAPLTDDQQAQVKRFTKLLYEESLAELVVVTDEPGAKVTLDGVELFVGPGRWQGVVRPETTKALLATKPGFQTQQIQPKLEKGKINTIRLELTPLDMKTRYVHDFDTWIPWAFIGGGAAILAGGGLLTWQATSSFSDYDAAVAKCNADNPLTFTNDAGVVVDGSGRVGSCIADSSVTSKKDDGETFQNISIAAYAVGGAAVVTGIILALINTEHPITEEVPSDQPEPTPVTLVPYVGPSQAGLTATFGF